MEASPFLYPAENTKTRRPRRTAENHGEPRRTAKNREEPRRTDGGRMEMRRRRPYTWPHGIEFGSRLREPRELRELRVMSSEAVTAGNGKQSPSCTQQKTPRRGGRGESRRIAENPENRGESRESRSTAENGGGRMEMRRRRPYTWPHGMEFGAGSANSANSASCLPKPSLLVVANNHLLVPSRKHHDAEDGWRCAGDVPYTWPCRIEWNSEQARELRAMSFVAITAGDGKQPPSCTQ